MPVSRRLPDFDVASLGHSKWNDVSAQICRVVSRSQDGEGKIGIDRDSFCPLSLERWIEEWAAEFLLRPEVLRGWSLALDNAIEGIHHTRYCLASRLSEAPNSPLFSHTATHSEHRRVRLGRLPHVTRFARHRSVVLCYLIDRNEINSWGDPGYREHARPKGTAAITRFNRVFTGVPQ